MSGNSQLETMVPWQLCTVLAPISPVVNGGLEWGHNVLMSTCKRLCGCTHNFSTALREQDTEGRG